MGPDERQELKALLDRVERSELHGDVGRMIFLALENAADERDHEAAAQQVAASQNRLLINHVKRLLSDLSPDKRGG
jgi:uncharacterized protein (UPF0335 family)